jgi:hypothetical protein
VGYPIVVGKLWWVVGACQNGRLTTGVVNYGLILTTNVVYISTDIATVYVNNKAELLRAVKNSDISEVLSVVNLTTLFRGYVVRLTTPPGMGCEYLCRVDVDGWYARIPHSGGCVSGGSHNVTYANPHARGVMIVPII